MRLGETGVCCQGAGAVETSKGPGESEDSKSKRNLQAHWWDLLRAVCLHREPKRMDTVKKSPAKMQ